jgi:hypothetical protein
MGKRPMTAKEIEDHKAQNPGSRVKTTYCDKIFAAPALTYIDEKAIEHRLQSCLDANGAYSQAMAWGKLMETIVFNTVGLEYQIVSKETSIHPKHKFWSGSADMIVPKIKCVEIKCYQYKKFAKFTDVLLAKDFVKLKTDFLKEYWQVVSNSIIHGYDRAELISYMPYKSELVKIRELIEESNLLEANGFNPWEFRFIVEKPLEELAYLPDDGYYTNLTKFEFEIPKADIKFLNDRVVLASKLLKQEIKKFDDLKKSQK